MVFFRYNKKSGLRSLFLFLLVFFFSCASDTSQEEVIKNTYIIPKDSLIPILVDFHLTDAVSKQNFIPNNANNYFKYQQYKSILEKHHISKERFDSTMKVYSGNIAAFEVLYDSIISCLELKNPNNHLRNQAK